MVLTIAVILASNRLGGHTILAPGIGFVFHGSMLSPAQYRQDNAQAPVPEPPVCSLPPGVRRVPERYRGVMLRPRPVPSPTDLVVKNGSKIWGKTSTGMPQPLSITSIITSFGLDRVRIKIRPSSL